MDVNINDDCLQTFNMMCTSWVYRERILFHVYTITDNPITENLYVRYGHNGIPAKFKGNKK